MEKVAPWWEYQERFVTAERISDGAQFWTEHRDALEHAAAQYQVPAEYIVAILGVETHYGRNTGRYRVLDALATLAFDYPPREKFFRRELEQFLLLAKENKLDPRTVTGSYAGAMGAPQFMPSQLPALRRGREHRPPARPVERLGRHHRQRRELPARIRLGRPAARCWPRRASSPTRTSRSSRATCELNETVDSLSAHGVKVLLDVPGDTPALLLSAEQPDGPAYRVGFHNFYVITRYNAQRPLRHGRVRPGRRR